MRTNLFALFLCLLTLTVSVNAAEPASTLASKATPSSATAWGANNKQLEYKTIIYTDKTLAADLEALEAGSRGFGMDLLTSMGNAAIGVATGYISSLIDLGIQAIGQLITMDRRHKEEWLKAVEKESTFNSEIATLSELNNFYSQGSSAGALDPRDIQFGGIGCLAKVAQDTAFYVSCSLNRDKLNRLLDHSQFELVLDTLVLDPYHAHLPNSPLPLSFSFAERKSFNFKMTIQLISSWMDFTIHQHRDEPLGTFTLMVPVDSASLNEDGKIVYIRQSQETPKYDIIGESFIVPRSYVQMPMADGTVADHYGTGQYKLKIEVEEKCGTTPEMLKNWRTNRKARKELEKGTKDKPTFNDVWRTITHQSWDESLQAWVVTILKAPADLSVKTMKGKMQIQPQQEVPKQ